MSWACDRKIAAQRSGGNTISLSVCSVTKSNRLRLTSSDSNAAYSRISTICYIEFVRRTDDVIISSGYRIDPEEIEDCLVKHEAVVDAAAISVPNDVRGEVPKAFVVVAPNYSPSDDLVDDLQVTVKSDLAKYEYPGEIEFIDDLPTTSTGKIRRTELRQRDGLKD